MRKQETSELPKSVLPAVRKAKPARCLRPMGARFRYHSHVSLQLCDRMLSYCALRSRDAPSSHCCPSPEIRMIKSPQLRHDRIEDYAFISDCVTGALVSRRGSVDWLYWPRFNSSACFAALLGDRRHGFWRIGPTSRARVSRCYRQEDIDLGHPLRYCKWVRRADRFHATPIRDIPRDPNSKRHFRSCDDEQRDGTAASSMDRRSRGSKQLTTAPYAQICGPEMVLLRSLPRIVVRITRRSRTSRCRQRTASHSC